MGEISKLLQERVNLSAEQADSAETEVLSFLRSRIPAQFQGVLDTLLGSHSESESADKPAGDALGGLGGLVGAAESIFGGSKE